MVRTIGGSCLRFPFSSKPSVHFSIQVANPPVNRTLNQALFSPETHPLRNTGSLFMDRLPLPRHALRFIALLRGHFFF